MEPFKAWDIKDMTVVISGVPLHGLGGAAETFLELEPEADMIEDEIASDGQVTACLSNDLRVNVRVTCQRMSAIMDRLSALMQLQRITPNGAAIGPSVVKDAEGNLAFNSERTYLIRPPAFNIGKMAGTATWPFRVADGISKSFFGGR